MVEMLVSISILSVLMTGLFGFLWGVSDYWSTGQEVAETTEDARLGLNRMTRELKQASLVSSPGTNQVTFTVDFGSGPETITYGSSTETGTVWRSANGGSALTLMSSVASVQFLYYGNDYRCDANSNAEVTLTELQSCSSDPNSSISRVDIVLTMTSGEQMRTFVGQAWLRNRSTV